MTALPSLGRYDAAVLAATLVLVFFAYVVYPVHIVQMSVVLVVFTIYLTWLTFFLHRWAFEEKL